MKNELLILNYILCRLDSIKDCADAEMLTLEVKVALKALMAVPSYAVDDVIAALFGTVEVPDVAE